MYSKFFKFSSEVQRIKFPIIAFIAIGYIFVGLLLFKYYDEKVKNEKLLFLDNSYKLILETSLNKFQSLASRLNTDLQASYIFLNNNYIKICENEKCIDYELQKFRLLLEQSIPNFNEFKIELNNNLLYSSFVSKNYEIEKTHYLNQDNKLIIRVNVDNNYWNQLAKDIRKPLWVVINFLSISFIIVCYIYKTLSKRFKEEYKNKYETEIRNCEKLWMTKLWDIESKKTKDIEINYLFSREAAKITLLSEKDSLDKQDRITRFKPYSEEKLYCSIALYNPADKEEIDIKKLIKIFTSRFDKEDENISFSIACHEKQIYFSSAAAFYQIIYSIINYLFFIVKKQFYNNKHQINLFITSIAGKLSFSFSYSGVPLEKEKDLFAVSNEFTKSHANPFILSIEQVFKLLKLNGFNCKVSYDKTNIIEISEKAIKKSKAAKDKDNIIYLAGWDREE
ncbi:MAG TPA: hypothetical protein LFW20_05210 [Rickettsia endosymbiont of Omalisus fontisbellaquei]|nr:hypothetical protein [Rickettsia endosymbiont of Omalisus fontisbellaquei]